MAATAAVGSIIALLIKILTISLIFACSILPDGDNIITAAHANLIITKIRHGVHHMSIRLIIGHSFHRLLHITDIDHFYNMFIVEDYCVLVVPQDCIARVLYWVPGDMGFCFPVVPDAELF